MFLGHDKFVENRENKMEIYLHKASFYQTMKNKIEFSFKSGLPRFWKDFECFSFDNESSIFRKFTARTRAVLKKGRASLFRRSLC